jgi:hypothetical protein
MQLPVHGDTLANVVGFSATDFESAPGVRSSVEQWQLALLGEFPKAS